MHSILMADDDREFCSLVSEYLAGHNLAISPVHDGQTAVDALASGSTDFAAMILDVMMPVMDGFATLQAIRRNNPIPILMLTARGEDIDRIMGLEMGADDYLPKPCNPRELAARLKALIRRASPASDNHETLQAGLLELIPARREVRLNGESIAVTSIEFEVLHSLAESAGEPVDRDKLMRQALGRRWSPSDRSLDMHIVALRRKLGNDRIKTLRGKGYQLIR